MSSVGTAERTAQRASDSKALEIPTRAGFVGYGVLHLAVGWLALMIAMGRSPAEGDQSGAFQLLARQPGGRVLLVVIVVGLAAMALWQALQAAVGYREEHGARKVGERLGSGGRAVVYAALGWTAAKVVAGTPTSSAGQQQHATAGMLGHPFGRVAVAVAGLAVLGFGIGLVVYGVKTGFLKRLRTELLGRFRPLVTWLGRIGYAAKGVAFGIVGLLLIDAALADQATRSRGLDSALRTVAGKPFGVFLLALIAVGFAAFGVYCFFQARYRKV